nr:probable E3 ubiquitin-protein ligase HECTD4 isoform X6 [Danio rerio]|eukprot:XP_021324839.1 probable E3 ubiquitin-protein ligase HECTD4 isoform X6 [Danio rerio]
MDLSCLVSAVEAAGVGEMVWGIFSWHTLGPLVQPCILKVHLSSLRWRRFPSPSQKSAWTSTFPARLLQRESTQLPQRSAPEQFTLEEIPITESKVSMDVNFSGSSPAKRVNSKSVSPPPGAVLVLHSLLLEFPLSMAFAEQLLTYSVGETIERSEDELDTVPTSVLIQVVELLGVPVESLRLRFALLQSLNSKLENFFLPLVELRLTQTYQNSIATLLCEAKGSCCAVKVLWRVCTATWPSSTSLPPRVLTHSHTSSTSLQCVTSHLNICSSCPISC